MRTAFDKLQQFFPWIRSLRGIRYAWPEMAFKQQVAIAMVISPLPFIFNTTSVEKAFLFGSIILVFISEICNTAIECVVNMIQPNFDPLAGKAKDLGSAAVCLADFNFLMVWLMIFLN